MVGKILISIISATLAGMGIGGGALFVMLATTFLGFEQKVAQALNLVMFIAVGITATISNFKDKKVDLKIAKKMIICLIIGSFIGTFLFDKINNYDLKKYFSYFLVVIGIYEIITSVIRLVKTKNNIKKKGE